MKTRLPHFISIALLVMLFTGQLASCSREASLKFPALSTANTGAVDKAGGSGRVYRLGPGDKLEVLVEGISEHSGQFDVNAAGSVSMPFVGSIRAAGLTVSEFKRDVTIELRKYVRSPQVRIRVLNYRPFYIQGEVKKAGQYDYREGLDVQRAVAMAGGYTYRASKSYIYIQHANESQRNKYRLDSDVPVQPGDSITVPERIF